MENKFPDNQDINKLNKEVSDIERAVEKKDKFFERKIDSIESHLEKEIHHEDVKVENIQKEVKEIEKEIVDLNKATKALFKAFDGIHTSLSKKYRWYYKWHTKKVSTPIHYIGLVAATAFIIYIFGFQLGFFGGHHEPTYADTGINKMMNYQGKLTDASNIPVPDGSYNMKISIYSESSGGTPIWTWKGLTSSPEAVSVPVTNAIFSVMLGDTVSYPGTNALNLDFNSDTYYLGITVGTDAEMSPRKRIGAAGYAYNSDTLDGKHETDFALLAGRSGGQTLDGGTDANDDLTLQGTTDSTRTSSYVIIQPNGGNVGIGDSTPTEKLTVADSSTNSTPAIKLSNDTKAWRLLIDGADNDILKLQETTDSNANVFAVTPDTQDIAFSGNVDANAGLDVTGALTVSTTGTFTNSVIANGGISNTDAESLTINANGTQKIILGNISTGDIDLTRNVNALAGLDVTGNITLIQGSARSISVTQNASGAGDNLTISAGSAFASSNTNGGNLILNAGAKDGSGTAGVIQIGGSDTSAVTITPVATFEAFPVTPSSAPTTDYQVANKKYVDDSVVDPAGSNMQMQYNNSGSFGGAAQVLYDNVNNYLGIGTFPTSYDTYTKFVDHMEGSGSSFVDSALGHTVSVTGNVIQTTSRYKFGSKSAVFSGDWTFLGLDATSSDFQFGYDDFTIDAWINMPTLPTTAYKSIISQDRFWGNPYDYGWYITSTGVKLQHAIDGAIDAPYVFSTDTWYHLALVRHSGVVTLYVNGVAIGSQTMADVFGGSGTYLAIGRSPYGESQYSGFNGYIDELRISKSIARWTSNFTPPTSAYAPDSTNIDEQLQVSNISANSTPAIKVNNDTTGWRLLVDGADSDKLKLQETTDSNANVFTVDPSTQSVTFYANLNANSGIDITGAALTIDNQAITQTTGGQVTFAGNVDANAGVDVTGNITLIQGGARSVSVTQNASGAGNSLTISAGAAFASSNTNGGNLILNAGAKDGSGTAGVIQIGGSNTSAVTITPVATFEAFPVTPSSAPTTDYQVANKKYVDDSVVDPAGSNMEMQYNNNGSFGGASQVLYDDVNNYLGIGTFPESYDTYTKLMMHMEGNGQLFDDSALNHTVTPAGDITQTDTQYKFGAKSALLDGTGDYLQVPYDSDFNFSSGLWTIDTWMRPSSLAKKTLFGSYTYNSSFNLVFNSSTSIRYNYANFDSGYVTFSCPEINLDAWHHVALVANGTTIELYVDGQSCGSTTHYPINTNNPLDIGTIYGKEGPDYYSNPFQGYIDEFRISKGIARWTSNFTPPTAAYEADTTDIDEQLQVSNLTANSTPAIKVNNDATGWRLIVDGADSDKLKLQETTDSNANVFTVDPGTQSVTFFANLNANSGIDISGAALTIDNQAITQTTGGQVTFAGNVDANAGLDVTGNITLIQGGSRSISVTQNASGAGDNLTISAGSAFASSNTNGGNLILNAGAKDGSGTAGVIQIGGSNTSAVTITPVATFVAFPVTPSSDPTTDYQVANKQYVDNHITNPAGDNMEMQYNNNGDLGGASQVLYDSINSRLGIGTFPTNYDTYTKLMLHMEGGGQSFTDSALNKSVTANGTATQSSNQFKFGSKSAYFDGNSSGTCLTIPNDTDSDFSSGDWTIDTWFNTSTIGRTIFMKGDTGGYNDREVGLSIINSTTLRYDVGTSDYDVSVPTISTSTWYHVALVRHNDTVTFYFNGTAVGSASNTPHHTTRAFTIGRANFYDGGTDPFFGYIDEFRISMGIARWTSNFTPPTSAYEPTSTTIDEQLQVSNIAANSTPAIKVNNDATGWRLIVDGADSDKLKLQETTDSNANVFTVDPGTQSVTFYANLNANSGIDITGAALTIDNQAITQTTGGQVTFAGNVDANSGLDVTGNITLIQGSARSISVTQNASGAGDNLTISAGAAFASSNTNGGNLILNAGAADGSGTAGVIQIGGSNTSAVTITPVATFEAFPVTPSSAPTTDYQVANKKYVDDSVVDPAGSNMQMQYNNDGYFGGATQVLYDDINSRLGIGSFLETYDSYTKLMLHMEGDGQSFVDSALNKTVTAHGDITQTATQYKFGAKSAIFDGTADYLTLADSDDWDTETTFTIDFWCRFNAVNSTIFVANTDDAASVPGFQIAYQDDIHTIFYNVASGGSGWDRAHVSGSWAPNINTWYHIAVVANAGSVNIYIDGNSVGNGTTLSSSSSSSLNIGIDPGIIKNINGYIDEFRISKGIARWTSDFTPPTQAYEPTSIAINEQLQVSNVATDSTPAIKVNNDTTGWRFLVDGADSDKLKLQETTDSNANILTVTSGTQAVAFSGNIDALSGLDVTGALTVTTTGTIPTVYGSVSDNGDIAIEGTSSATKTTSYVNLQPNGGYVGIGTTSPLSILDVVSATDHVDMILDSGSGKQAAIHFFENGVSSWKMGAVGDDNDRFAIKYNETAEVFTILTGGNVGIGTASPNELLTVASDLGTGYQRVATFLDTNSGAIDPHIMVGNGTDANKGMALGWDSTNNVAWIAVSGDGAGDGFTQKRGGTVGIGTATPGTGDASVFQTVLEVHKSTANSDPAIVLSNDAQTWGILTVGSRNDNFEIVDSTAAGDPTRLTIDTNGKVGIGTAAPSWLLHVKGTTAANSGIVELENTYTDGEAGIIFKNDAHQWNSYVNSSDKYVIRDDTQSNDAITLTPTTDYVGINYASPDCELWVKDGPDALGNADIVISSDTGAASAMHWINNTTGKWTMKSDGADSDKFTFEIDSGADVFSVANATQVLTFAQFPITPSSAPTTDYQVANKKYVDDAGTTYALLAGRSGGQTLYGGTDANDDLTLQGTSNSTRATSYVNIQPNGGNVGIGTTAPGQELTIQRLATTEKESLLSVDQMALSELQGGAYFGNINITENQWELSDIGSAWSRTGVQKNWQDVAMNSNGKYQTAVDSNNGYIYVSSDFGVSWSTKDSQRNWYGIAMSSDGKIQTAVAGGYGTDQIYVSTDYGNTWTAKDSARHWNSIAMSSDGKYQAATTFDSDSALLYVSTDYGNTWTAKAPQGWWTSIAMSSDGKIQTAVAGGSLGTANQIYISTDYGNTWTAKDSARHWESIAMSSDGKIQTAVAGGQNYTDQIYISTDYGNTWTAKDSARHWQSVAISANGQNQLAGENYGYLYASTDYGATWTAKTAVSRYWYSIAMNSDGKVQLAGDNSGYLYESYAASYTNGKVGIGVFAPTNGGLVVASGVTIGTDSTDNLIDDSSNGAGSATLYIGNKTIDTSVPSDARIKTNIVPTAIGLDDLMQFNVVDFNFTADYTNDTTALHHGMIAQDVAQIYPYAVSMRSDGLMMIDYDNMMPLVIKSIQEQQKEIDSISKLNGDLQGNIYKDITTDEIIVEKDTQFKKDVEVVGSVSIAKDLKVEGQSTFGKDSVGQAKILTGAKRVKVTFEKEYEYQPVVTITPTGIFDIQYAVENTTTKGFEIVIEPNQAKDVIFNWHAFGVDEGKIFVSDGTTQDIELITSLPILTPTP